MSRIISWTNTNLIDPKILNNLTEFINKKIGTALPLSRADTNNLTKFSKKNNLSLDTIKSIRNIMSTHNNIVNHRKYESYFKNTDKFIHDYAHIFLKIKYSESPIEANKYLLCLINSLSIDPSNLLKLLHKKQVRDKLHKSNINMLDNLSIGAKKINKQTLVKSQKYENELEQYIRRSCPNIKIMTEKELQDKGYKCTPDILFVEPIIIMLDNTKYEINWIDAKNYAYISNTKYSRHTEFMLKKQATKYNLCFGYGAFVFSKGIMTTTKNNNTTGALILDGSKI
jgi:hypothetical protein